MKVSFVLSVFSVLAADVAIAASMAKLMEHHRRDNGQGTDTECPVSQGKCTGDFYNRGKNYPYWAQLVGIGSCDTSAMAEFILDKGDYFETYLSNRWWVFEGDYTSDYPKEQALYTNFINKMNGLVGPVLQMPFYDDSVSEADLRTYSNKLLTLLYTPEETSFDCTDACRGQDSCTVAPYAISFPFYDYYAAQGSNDIHEAEFVQNWWLMDYAYIPTDMEIDIRSNHQGTCQKYTESYSHSISTTNTATSSNTIGQTFGTSFKITQSATVKEGFGMMSATESTSVEAGFTSSTSASLTTTESFSQTETSEATKTYPIDIPDGALMNNTMFVNQIHADLTYTGDVVYDANHQLIYPWYQTNAKFRPHIPIGLTIGTVKNLVQDAMDLTGISWSNQFVDNMFTSSITGRSKSIQGTMVISSTNFCDLATTPANSCTEYDAEMYPIQSNDCKA
eukprot:Clim_evm2s211 gene=Clim_evmTU2s211